MVPTACTCGMGPVFLGQIFIWDITSPKTPTVYSPGAKPAQSSDVTCVGWNKKVQHIMASTSSNGTSVVWDLKLKRPVISFSDPNGRQRCSSLVPSSHHITHP